jgi:5-formyltetrahydrofolate cyclo-ligase
VIPVFDPEFEALLRHRAKTELRKRMRAVRNAIPLEARAARSQAIVQRVLETPEFQRAVTVALYWPMLERNEIDVRELDGAARNAGKNVAYPAITEEGMALACADPADMVERGHGFAEPPEGAPTATVDAGMLIVVPALAVDPQGHRIGYGKGFYDWLLARVAPPAFALAVAYDFQVVAEVPTTPNDRAVGLVVTDRRSFRPTS